MKKSFTLVTTTAVACCTALLLSSTSVVVTAQAQAQAEEKNDEELFYADSAKNKAIELTDESFEIETAGISGAENDWLILFCEYERLRRCREY